MLDDTLVFYLDFETTGLDVLRHHIVEIGVLCENNACFSTVVCPPVFAEGPLVHGIADEGLREGPSFTEAFHRMYSLCENLSAMALIDDDSSSDEAAPPTLREYPPRIMICAHNGLKFDFPFLCSERLRQGVDLGFAVRWRFVDTLEVVRASSAYGCVKLQCMLERLSRDGHHLRAHRALDRYRCRWYTSMAMMV